jgi:hypothetical protein
MRRSHLRLEAQWNEAAVLALDMCSAEHAPECGEHVVLSWMVVNKYEVPAGRCLKCRNLRRLIEYGPMPHKPSSALRSQHFLLLDSHHPSRLRTVRISTDRTPAIKFRGCPNAPLCDRISVPASGMAR